MSDIKARMMHLRCSYDERHLQECVKQGWVAAGYDDIDLARAQLIHLMRVEWSINDEALPVILSLLDQLHGTRRILRQVSSVLALQSDEVRAELEAVLHDHLDL